MAALSPTATIPAAGGAQIELSRADGDLVVRLILPDGQGGARLAAANCAEGELTEALDALGLGRGQALERLREELWILARGLRSGDEPDEMCEDIIELYEEIFPDAPPIFSNGPAVF